MVHFRPLVQMIGFFLFFATLIPSTVAAFPFGGQITLFHVCYNETLFARLSPPVPGDYVWTTATKTYQFGPPQSTGQWLLGLTGIPFDCLWSINPIFPVPAISIMMMGSSQSGPFKTSSGSYTADPTQLKGGTGGFGNANPTYTGATQYTGGGIDLGGGANGGTLVVSEVFPVVDSAHGADPAHEWIELFNGTRGTVDVSGWTIRTDTATSTLPAGSTISPGGFLIITPQTTLRNFWTISSSVRVSVVGNDFGDGLSGSNEYVQLRNKDGTLVDAVSWGSNTKAFTPSAVSVPSGRSLSRLSVLVDRNIASDWIETAPTPGN